MESRFYSQSQDLLVRKTGVVCFGRAQLYNIPVCVIAPLVGLQIYSLPVFILLSAPGLDLSMFNRPPFFLMSGSLEADPEMGI